MSNFLTRQNWVLQFLGGIFLVVIAVSIFVTCPLWEEPETEPAPTYLDATPVPCCVDSDESFMVEPVFDERLRDIEVVRAYPVLVYGQEVTLNSVFYTNVKAIVMSPDQYNGGFYWVRLKEGPGGHVRIDSRITREREE